MKFIITLPCGVDTCITNEMFAFYTHQFGVTNMNLKKREIFYNLEKHLLILDILFLNVETLLL